MPELFSHRPRTLAEAERQIAAIQARLAARGIPHRAPPPPPDTCCGRGCNGCVWEGYYAALAWWREEAVQILGLNTSPLGKHPTEIVEPQDHLG